MFARRQIPALSPVSAAALFTGFGALFAGGRAPAAAARALLSSEFGSHTMLFTDTGTSSLRLAIQAAASSRPGLIALPAFSCFDVSSAAEGAGTPFLFYDVDPVSLGPDPESLGTVLRAGATVIVVAHLFGVPVDLDAVRDMAAGEGALVIEDAAQGAGATLSGRRLGSIGSLGVLSFARGKGITGGGGGALLANDEPGIQALRATEFREEPLRSGLKELGRAAAVFALARPNLYGPVAALPFLHLGETVYRPPRLPAAAARSSLAMLPITWSLSERETETRQRNAFRLLAAIEKSRTLRAAVPAPGSKPGYLRLPVVVSPSLTADPREIRRLGIAPSYPRALNRLQSTVPLCRNRDTGFPGAEELAARLLTLPTHSRLAERDLVALEKWIATHG